MQSDRIYVYVEIMNFHMFEQDSALAHRACEKVEEDSLNAFGANQKRVYDFLLVINS